MGIVYWVTHNLMLEFLIDVLMGFFIVLWFIEVRNAWWMIIPFIAAIFVGGFCVTMHFNKKREKERINWEK